MNQFEPGDVIEIRTPDGFAYLQVTHNHPSYPEVVRALPGTHAKRPADLAGLAAGKSAFTAMIPLYWALKRGDLEGQKVTRADVPEPERAFPTFRIPIRDRKGNVVYWWFWDGEGLRYDADPDPSTSDMPLRDVTTADALVARITGS